MTALAPVRPELLLLRIWRPVLMLPSSPIVRLRQRGRRTRNQNGNGSRDKSGFHEITQSKKSGLQIVSNLAFVSQLHADRRQNAAHSQRSVRKRAEEIFDHLNLWECLSARPLARAAMAVAN
jgi:hypothetical protein